LCSVLQLYDHLRDDEERSQEESVMGDSTADFLASEDEEDGIQVRVVADPGVNDILAPVTSNVTWFID